MLAARLGPTHRVVRLSRAFEQFWGRLADASFCVSSAMRDMLVDQFLLRPPAIVRDRPSQLLPLLPATSRAAAARGVLATAGIQLPENAALAVCPTSWTADEDIDLLLAGLLDWDQHSRLSPDVRLFVLITGRGPLRDAFEARTSGISWSRVSVGTAFLDPSTYRELLRTAHLGFCLHRSTSGVDLPMKLVDLFGARTPACVLDYGDCLSEQVQPGRTALTFRNSRELAERVDEALEGFPDAPRRLVEMQQDIELSHAKTWLEGWESEAAPIFHCLSSH
jgi:beta-1,4-mannosyltransferase